MRILCLLLTLPGLAFGAPVARIAPVRAPAVNVGASGAALGQLQPALTLSAPQQGSALGQAGSSLVLPDAPSVIAKDAPKIIVPEKKKIIVPESGIIAAPKKKIIIAERELTEEEADVDNRPSAEALAELAKSLTSEAEPGERGDVDGQIAAALNAQFDGMSAADAQIAVEYFAPGPRAPQLSKVERAAHSLFRGLLPSFYRPIPVTARYDKSAHPETGHLWSAETGHIIELNPVRADSAGNVPSAFGLPGLAFVQQKIEQVIQFAHEYAHVVFDTVVRKAENHAPLASYSAMTEGFAVTLEQQLIDRAINNPGMLGLSVNDVADLVTIAKARRDWLNALDTHYSEGVLPWKKAYANGGTKGLLSFLSSLSAQRMIRIHRSDPVYQLASAEPDLLSAYLGGDSRHPARRGLEAFGRNARGEELDAGERDAAKAVIEAAGPEGRQRLFERTLLEDKRIAAPVKPAEKTAWYEKESKAPVSVEAVFALARLSPVGAAELAAFLTRTIQASDGARRLFGRPGPNEKLNAVVAGAESLPFDEAGRQSWSEALTNWLFGNS
ncbi:MAG: hypothetical protein ABIJ96_08460 [Elusimicrobiota bacterium]